MGSAIESVLIIGKRRIVGHAALGYRGGVTGSVKQQTHDGDTIKVRAVGNLGVRFLGVDAPEISFMLPRSSTFTGLANEKWVNFLKAPFDNFPEGDLKKHLENRVKGKEDDVALNHHRLASASEDLLEEMVDKDIVTLEKTVDTFQFYLAFAHKVMDFYGRLLCYINRDQPDGDNPEPRPIRYNMRLLEIGAVVPYFIWPNVDPWRGISSKKDAVLNPNEERYKSGQDDARKLQQSREFVQDARKANKGVFSKDDELILQPFEVRFLARESLPSRFVIDLSAEDDTIYKPEDYFKIEKIEDRLFIPPDYIDLFKAKEWKIQGE